MVLVRIQYSVVTHAVLINSLLPVKEQLKAAETMYKSIVPSITKITHINSHKLMERPCNFWTLQVLMGSIAARTSQSTVYRAPLHHDVWAYVLVADLDECKRKWLRYAHTPVISRLPYAPLSNHAGSSGKGRLLNLHVQAQLLMQQTPERQSYIVFRLGYVGV